MSTSIFYDRKFTKQTRRHKVSDALCAARLRCYTNLPTGFRKKHRGSKSHGKHTFGNEYGFQTRAVHTKRFIDAETGAIKRPITMANSYALPWSPSDLNWSSAKNLYTRNGGSNQQYLQEKLASLEGGEDCVVLASGVAALSGLFFALLEKRRSCGIFPV